MSEISCLSTPNLGLAVSPIRPLSHLSNHITLGHGEVVTAATGNMHNDSLDLWKSPRSTHFTLPTCASGEVDVSLRDRVAPGIMRYSATYPWRPGSEERGLGHLDFRLREVRSNGVPDDIELPVDAVYSHRAIKRRWTWRPTTS